MVGRRLGSPRELAVIAGMATALAVSATVAGVVIVLAVEAPTSGLLPRAWRVLVEPRSAAWLTVALVAVPLAYALRPVTGKILDRWLTRRSLPQDVAGDAAAELRRTRLIRTLTAVLGIGVGLGTYSSYQLAISLAGRDASVVSTLYAADLPGRYPGVLLTAAGYLVGVVIAEVTRRRPPSGAGQGRVTGARLEPRRTANYLTRPARLLPIGVAGLVAALGVARGSLDLPTIRGPLWPSVPLIVGVIIALVVGAPAAQAWLVRRPQRAATSADLALDDTFRSSAAHGIVAATLVAGLAVTMELLSDVWNAVIALPALVPWGAFALFYALVAGMALVWLRYGTAHPGRRPSLADGAP